MCEAGPDLQPDTVSYNTALKAAGNAHQVTAAMHLYQAMVHRGVRPNVTTFGALLSAAAEAGQVEALQGAWGALVGSGLEVNAACTNTYVAALVKLGRWEEAQAHFHAMLSTGSKVKPTATTFNALMQGHLERAQHDKVREVYDAMQPLGLQASVVTYNTLLAAHGQCGRWSEALDVLSRMEHSKMAGVAPTTASFNCVLSALSRAQEAAAAAGGRGAEPPLMLAGHTLELLQRMQRPGGPSPDARSFTLALGLLAGAEQWAQAVAVDELRLAQGCSLDASVAAAVSSAYAAQGMYSRAQGALLFALARGQAVQLPPAAALLVAHCVTGAWEEAVQLLRALAQAGGEGHGGVAERGNEVLFAAADEAARLHDAAAALQFLHWAQRCVPGAAESLPCLYCAVVERLMGAQQLAGALQVASDGHDEGCLRCYALPASARAVGEEEGGRVDVAGVRSTQVALAVVLAWLLRLAHAVQAGIPIQTEELVIVTGESGEVQQEGGATLLQLVARVCRDGMGIVQELLAGAGSAVAAQPLPVAQDAARPGYLVIKRSDFEEWLRAGGCA